GLPDVALAAYRYGGVVVFADPGPGAYAWTDATTEIYEAGIEVGASLVTGDLDADGNVDLLVGNYTDNSTASGGGSAWIFLDVPAGALGRANADADIYASEADQYLGTAVGCRDGYFYAVASWRDTTVSRGGVLYEIAPW
ncbi:MAG: hypothetical protein FJ102_02725, partial [Deltaproteobacteria bacterium]|nr:hypothetical protein [Deltaproteobacteria bacterium]